jgi:hypothetical protein
MQASEDTTFAPNYYDQTLRHEEKHERPNLGDRILPDYKEYLKNNDGTNEGTPPPHRDVSRRYDEKPIRKSPTNESIFGCTNMVEEYRGASGATT